MSSAAPVEPVTTPKPKIPKLSKIPTIPKINTASLVDLEATVSASAPTPTQELAKYQKMSDK